VPHTTNSHMNSRPAARVVAGREPPQTTVLRGRTLLLARAAWIVVALLTLGLFVASIPLAYQRFLPACENSGCDIAQLSPEAKNALEGLGLGLSMGHYAAYTVLLAIVLALGYWLIGGILFWKRSDNRLVLYASMMLVTFGTIQADTLYWLVEAYPVWDLPVALVDFVAEASFFLLFCVFPDGRFVPRWTRWAAAAWIAYWLLLTFFPDSPLNPISWSPLIDNSLFLGLLGSLVAAQIYRYRRHSDQTARQETKWVVWGFTATLAGFIAVELIGWIFDLTRPGIPELLYKSVGNAVITLCALLIPLSIGVAILRYRLWDIDLIIRRSLVIGPLATILTVVFELANQLLLPFIFRFIPGIEDSSSIKTVVSVLIVVVLFKPLHARLNADVNRLVDWLVVGRKQSRRLARRRG
jgi:hypothetical protein